MICFEVYRNGERLCTTGVGEYGVMAAHVDWVSHHPRKLARWAKQGMPKTESKPFLRLEAGGLIDTGQSPEHDQHFRWIEAMLAVGDEIRIRIVEASEADPPAERLTFGASEEKPGKARKRKAGKARVGKRGPRRAM